MTSSVWAQTLQNTVKAMDSDDDDGTAATDCTYCHNPSTRDRSKANLDKSGDVAVVRAHNRVGKMYASAVTYDADNEEVVVAVVVLEDDDKEERE